MKHKMLKLKIITPRFVPKYEFSKLMNSPLVSRILRMDVH